MITAHAQRWRNRRDAYVPAASVINPAEFSVAAVDEAQAKPFVLQHHYSGTFPAARLSVGLFRGRQLVGVATFSVPMNSAAIPTHTGLADPQQGCDLGRFVLLDEVAGNGETWFLARALRILRAEKPGVLAVVSCADPLPRLTAAGVVVKPGHVGQIYKAMSAPYRGRTRARYTHALPDGRQFSERAISKLRSLDTGHAYAVDQLVAAGADRPLSMDLGAWFDRLVADGFVTRQRHPGNHVYAFQLTHAARLAGRDLPARPYPQMEPTHV